MSRAAEIGSLRRRVTLEAPIDVIDDAGSMTRSYAPLADLWAQVTPVNGESRFEAARQESSITHIVRIRWRNGVLSEMRFALGPRRLRIHAVFDPDERKAFLICHCEEIKP
jgi:SPP1 family predicted phage head-tail adaptor